MTRILHRAERAIKEAVNAGLPSRQRRIRQHGGHRPSPADRRHGPASGDPGDVLSRSSASMPERSWLLICSGSSTGVAGGLHRPLRASLQRADLARRSADRSSSCAWAGTAADRPWPYLKSCCGTRGSGMRIGSFSAASNGDRASSRPSVSGPRCSTVTGATACFDYAASAPLCPHRHEPSDLTCGRGRPSRRRVHLPPQVPLRAPVERHPGLQRADSSQRPGAFDERRGDRRLRQPAGPMISSTTSRSGRRLGRPASFRRSRPR